MINKKLILFLITGSLCVMLLGCAEKDKKEDVTQNTNEVNPAATSTAPTMAATAAPTPAAPVLSVKEFAPTKENVKQIGRTYPLGETLWLAFSASGFEFTFTGTKADIKLIGDNIAVMGTSDTNFCRYGIYVNDELIADDVLKVPEKTVTAFESDAEETVTIKVLKLSEAASSTLGIGKILVTSKEPILPTQSKTHRIEFIGDSITCGFGVDDNDVNAPFSTATEDATKTYAYKTAQALDADYSMVALSGYGIISGYTASGVKSEGQLIPKYYDKMGFSYGYFNRSITVANLDWDFSRFIPELLVINLGTNDSSYCGSDSERQEEFVTGYIAFLKQVREKNPDATILCTLGIMGDILYPSIEKAVSIYSEETGDTKVYSMKFDVQQASDGYGACWHPSQATHTKASEKLTQEIRNILGW